MKVQSECIQNFVSTTMINLCPHSQHRAEEVVRSCYVKTVLSKISKNSQENTEISFNKVAELQLATFRQRCFPVNFTKFLGTPFYRTPV